MNNSALHKHPEARAWCAAHRVELVFLPTYASWLNWIETEFTAPRYFALNGTDHRGHAEQDAAISDYIRWRNQRARPKSGFATSSKIRQLDYPFKAGRGTRLIMHGRGQSGNRRAASSTDGGDAP